MSTGITREINGSRFVETNRGDTLQAIALRELGDGARWPELVAFNNLLPPFITDDASVAGPQVLLTGALIRVPAADNIVDANVDADLVFERDVLLDGAGQPSVAGGDFALVSGVANLHQAIVHRLTTDRGELPFHPEYGSLLRRIVGSVNGPTAGLLAASYAKSAVQEDSRISSVTSAEAQVSGDSVTVTVVAEPIVGRAIDVTQTI